MTKVFYLEAENGVISGVHRHIYADRADANVKAAELVNVLVDYVRDTYDYETGEAATADTWEQVLKREIYDRVEADEDEDDEREDTLGNDWNTAGVFVLEMEIEGGAMIPVSALESLVEGSDATGRWLDARGHECDEDEEGATWEEYTEEEQNLWLQSVAGTLREEIAKAKGVAS